MASIGNLTANLSAETASFKTDLDKANRQLRSSSTKMNRSLSKLDRGFDLLSKKAGLFAKSLSVGGVAVGLTAAAAGFGLAAKRSLDFADSIAKTSDKVGFSTSQLQELRVAAGLAGVSTKNLDLSLQRFSRRLGEAAQGSGELKGTLDQYGIAARNVDGSTRANIDVLNDLANAIKGAESEQEALRIAFKAFDSEGAALVNLLRNGADGMDSMRQQARDLGLVIEESLLRNAEQTNDRLQLTAQIMDVRLKDAILRITPALDNMLRGFLEKAPQMVFYAERFLHIFGLLAEESESTQLQRFLEAQVETTAELVKWQERLASATQKVKDSSDFALGDNLALLERAQEKVRELTEKLGAIEARLAVLRKNQEGGGGVEVTVNPAPTTGGAVADNDPKNFPRAPDLRGFLQKRDEEALAFLQRIEEERNRLFESEIERIQRERDERLKMLDRLALSEEESAEARVQIRRNAAKEISEINKEKQEEILRQMEEEKREEERLLEERKRARDKFNEDMVNSGIDALERLATGYGDFKTVAIGVLADLIKGWLSLNRATASNGGGGGGFGDIFGGGGFDFGKIILGDEGGFGIPSLFGFADGGNPPVGRVSLVGEKGPELFVPQTRGTVIPNDITQRIMSAEPGEGGTVVQHINVHPDVSAIAEAQVRRMLPQILEMGKAANQEGRMRNPKYFQGTTA